MYLHKISYTSNLFAFLGANNFPKTGSNDGIVLLIIK